MRQRLQQITARAARSLKSALWVAAPFVSSAALIGTFALPVATALSGWCVLILVAAVSVVIVGFNVGRLTSMCVQRITWPLSPMELDQVALPQQPVASSGQSAGSTPVVHSYVFLTKSLLDLADAAAGVPFRIFTALLIIAFNCSAAVIALSVGLPLVGGGYSSLSTLNSFHAEWRVFSASGELPVNGCRFDIRAHLVPICGFFLTFLLFAGPTPLRRLQYWTTNFFRALSAMVVLATLLWSGCVPFLADNQRQDSVQSASLDFVNTEMEWFPIDIALSNRSSFDVPLKAPGNSGGAVEFLSERLGVSLALIMWLFTAALYSVRSSGHHLFGAELLRAQHAQLSAIRQRIQDAIAAGATPLRRTTARDEQESLQSTTRQRVAAATEVTQKTPAPKTSFHGSFCRTFTVFLLFGGFATCSQCASKYSLDSRVFQGPLALLWTAEASGGAAPYRCTVGVQEGLTARELRISAALCFLLGCVLLLWVPFFIHEASVRAVFNRRPATVADDENAAAKRFLRNKKRRAEEEEREAQLNDIMLSGVSIQSDVQSMKSVSRMRRLSQRAIRRCNVAAMCKSLKSFLRSLISCCSYWGGLWRCCDRTSRRGVPPADDVATEFDGTKVSMIDLFDRLRRKGATRRSDELLAFVAEFFCIRLVLLLLCVFCAVVTLSGERVRCISFWSFWKTAPYDPSTLHSLVFKSCDAALTPLTKELFVRITLAVAMAGGIVLAPLLLLVPMVILIREEWLRQVKASHQVRLAQIIRTLRLWRSPRPPTVSETPPAREYGAGGFAASHNSVSMSRFSRMNSTLPVNEQRLLSGFEVADSASGLYGAVDGSAENAGQQMIWSCPTFLRLLKLALYTLVSASMILLAFTGGAHATATYFHLSRHHILGE
jgi:hypothetical protein